MSMQVSYAGKTYDCNKAVREGSNASLYLTNGIVMEFVGVADRAWEKFQFKGGTWETVSQLKYIPTPEQSAVLMMRSMFSKQAADMGDDTIIRYSGLADEWQPGEHKTGDIYNTENQTWECYQGYDNDVYPDIKPGNPPWFTFNRPLHGKSKETARPFVPVQGAHDMYRSGEYTIFTDGKTYRCKSDTAYSPADFPNAWEVAS